MEAVVGPKQASTPGDIFASPLCAIYASTKPVVTAVGLHHSPRPGKV